MSNEDLQEKYMQLQIIEQQMKQIQKQIQLIESQMNELVTAHQALDDLKKTRDGTKMLVPISNGIFAKAEIKDNAELIVNVGANITVNKDIESTKGLITKQINEIKGVQEKMMLDLQKLSINGTSLEKELHKMISEQ